MLSLLARRNFCVSSVLRVKLSKDEKCFVAFHPDREYDYKFTKPLPQVQDEDESLLKVNAKNMITKSPNLEQLQSLTYTPARYWKEYIGREKRNKYKEYFDDNVDRKGLTS